MYDVCKHLGGWRRLGLITVRTFFFFGSWQRALSDVGGAGRLGFVFVVRLVTWLGQVPRYTLFRFFFVSSSIYPKLSRMVHSTRSSQVASSDFFLYPLLQKKKEKQKKSPFPFPWAFPFSYCKVLRLGTQQSFPTRSSRGNMDVCRMSADKQTDREQGTRDRPCLSVS